MSWGIITEERLINHFFLIEKGRENIRNRKSIGMYNNEERLLKVELCSEIAEDGKILWNVCYVEWLIL